MSADLASPVAGLRSLLMQAPLPLAMAGVDQRSGWRRDPVGRLAATSAYLATVTFGERAVAVQAAARVRRIHDHVRDTDPVTGRLYAAGDPALLLWAHAALVQSSLAAGWACGTPLSALDSDRAVEEMIVAAELVGVPRPQVPASVAELERYVASVRPGLRCTPAARESMAYLLDPPGLDEEIAGFCVEHDPEAFRRSLEKSGFLRPGVPLSTEAIVEHLAVFCDTIRDPGPLTITSDYASSVVRRFFDLRSPVAGYIAVPRSYVILQRINLGLFTVLGELSATANWRAISGEIWPFTQGPAATPIGQAEAVWRARRQAMAA